MRKFIKVLGILAAIAAVAPMQAAFAHCQDVGSVYPINQCGGATWFPAPPAGSGNVSAAYWQLGKGNLGAMTTAAVTAAQQGNCFLPANVPPFFGCDSGTLGADAASIGLDPADAVGGPPGSLCFGASASWTRLGNDGCCDNNTLLGGPLVPSVDDNKLNAIVDVYDSGSGQHFYDLYFVDAPIGVMLREDTGKHFAMAFLASQPRTGPADSLPGSYRLDELGKGSNRRGDQNPGKPPGAFDVIPWQPVPKVNVDNVVINAGTGERMVNVSWGAVRIIDDGSTRLGPNAGRCGGVGVRDCAPNEADLYRRKIQTGTWDGVNCGAWVDAPTAIFPNPLPVGAGTGSINTPGNLCLRMVTNLGLSPTALPANLTNCRRGNCGDLGVTPYPGVDPPAGSNVVIAPPGVSDRVNLVRAKSSGGEVIVDFNTASELNITRFDIFGKDVKGRSSLVTSVDPQQGSTGAGAQYSVSVKKSQLKGAKSIYVVSQPTGQVSNEVPVE